MTLVAILRKAVVKKESHCLTPAVNEDIHSPLPDINLNNECRQDACTSINILVNPYLNSYLDTRCNNAISSCSAASGSDKIKCKYIGNVCELNCSPHADSNSAAHSSEEVNHCINKQACCVNCINNNTNITNYSAAEHSSEINIHMLKCCNCQHTWCENCMSNRSTNIIDDKNMFLQLNIAQKLTQRC